MLTKPIIIELSKINEPETYCKYILKPKIAKAKRLSESDLENIQAQKGFHKISISPKDFSPK